MKSEIDINVNRQITRRGRIKLKSVYHGRSYMSLLSDEVFKKFFSDTKNMKYMCLLLSHFTDYSYDYLLAHMGRYTPELQVVELDQKKEVGDFVNRVDETFFSVEVNNDNTLKRNVEYADRLYATDVTRKSGRLYKYSNVIQLNLNNFTFLDRDGKPVEDIVDTYRIENKYGELYIFKVFINVCLVNIKKKYYTYGKESLSEKERCVLVMFGTDKKMLKDLANGEEMYEEFMDDMEYFINQKGLFRAYDHAAAERKADIEEAEEKGFDRGMMKGQAKGFNKGHAEGHAEGRAKERTEIARRLYEKKFSIKEIAEITGLLKKDLENILS